MINISYQIESMIRRIRTAENQKRIVRDGDKIRIYDEYLADYLNSTRADIAVNLDRIFREANIGSYKFADNRF